MGAGPYAAGPAPRPGQHQNPGSAVGRGYCQRCDGLTATVDPGTSEVGGGSLPLTRLPTFLVAITADELSAQELANRLRQGSPPVVARIANEQVLLDLRTVAPPEEDQLLAALAAAAERGR